jgi:Flp pilus assembly protein TadG
MIRYRRGRHGHTRLPSRAQALVEFALVAPIFFLILFSIIDFGRYVYYVQILNNAAREGARYAIVHGSHGIPSSGPPPIGMTSSDPSGANVIAVVRKQSIGVIGGGGAALDIQPQWLDGSNARGNTVLVTVSYPFKTIIPIVPIPTITITGESTLVINN